jgi:hypothetical protein
MSAPCPEIPAATLARLAELAEKLRGDVIADDEVAELETLLAESPAAREAFVGLAVLVAELRHSHGRLAWAPAPARARKWWRGSRRWLAPCGLAAVLAVAAIVVGSRRPGDVPGGRVPIATISNASGATLLAEGMAVSVPIGSTLPAGKWDLRSGLLELTYSNGVVLLLESPARFTLRDAVSIGLSEGNLSARVPVEGIGFAVETPSGRIVDLGTEFGISADATNSEVHVFKGEVVVGNPGMPDPLRLTSERASRIDTETQTPSGINFQPDRFFRSFAEPANGYSDLINHWGPVAYYRMQLTAAASQLDDLSSRQLHARIVHGTTHCAFVPGRFGAALRLGGTTGRSFAVVPDFPKAPTAALTVCAWVRAYSRPRWATIAKNWAKDRGINHGGQFHFGLHADEGGLEVHVHDAQGAEVWARETEPLPLDEWQFVAFTLDGATLRLFRNGRQVAAAPCEGLSQFAPHALGIGVKLDAGGEQPEINTPGFWDGALDELSIFHQTLSPEQIRGLYEAAR